MCLWPSKRHHVTDQLLDADAEHNAAYEDIATLDNDWPSCFILLRTCGHVVMHVKGELFGCLGAAA